MDNMKHGYAETIESAKFLTSQTKVHAIDKANDVHTFIGTDAWVMDDNKIDEYYKNVINVVFKYPIIMTMLKYINKLMGTV